MGWMDKEGRGTGHVPFWDTPGKIEASQYIFPEKRPVKMSGQEFYSDLLSNIMFQLLSAL